MLNTVQRTGKVLNLFTPASPEWGVTEVATALDLPKSTTFDIVASLAEIGFLRRTPDDRYRLGWRVLVITRRLMGSTCFNAQTHRTVAELATQLGAVVTIGAWDGHGVVCIANAGPDRDQRALAGEAHIAGYTSALAKLHMAQLPWPTALDLINQHGPPDLTEHSATDPDTLRAQLLSTRLGDMAVEHGQTVAGQSCVAVGIYQPERHAIAALSICVPSERMHARCTEYAQIARRTARLITLDIARR